MANEPLTSHDDRHPATTQIMRHFRYDYLPLDLQPFSAECADLAEFMVGHLHDGPELTTGLRKLLEAKDCFVRARLDNVVPAPRSEAAHGAQPH